MSACLGLFRLFFGCCGIVLGCSGCPRLFGLFRADLGCVGCFRLFGVALGCSLTVSNGFGSFRLLGCFRLCLVVLGCVRLL